MKGFALLPAAQAALAESLVPLPAGALPVSLFFQPEGIATLLEAARRRRPEAELRALGSLWSRWYFGKLIPPVLACGVLAGRSLPLDPAGTAMLLGEDGFPRFIALPGPGITTEAANPFARFAPLVLRHVAPVVEALAASLRLAPRILWNNAAVYADWALRRLAEEAPGPTTEAALALVRAAHWPGHGANPFHAPVSERAGPEGPQRVRRLCCLLYRLPGEGLCGTCPRRLLRPGQDP